MLKPFIVTSAVVTCAISVCFAFSILGFYWYSGPFIGCAVMAFIISLFPATLVSCWWEDFMKGWNNG